MTHKQSISKSRSIFFKYINMSNFPGGKKYGIAVKGPVACVDAPRRVYRSLLNIFSPWHQSHFLL